MPTNRILTMSAVASLVLLVLQQTTSHGIGVVLNTDFNDDNETQSDKYKYYDPNNPSRGDSKHPKEKFIDNDLVKTKDENGDIIEGTVSVRLSLSKLSGSRSKMSESRSKMSESRSEATKFKEHFNVWDELSKTKSELQCSWPKLLKDNVEKLNPSLGADDVFYLCQEDKVHTNMSHPCETKKKISTNNCTSEMITKDIGSDFFPRFVWDEICPFGSGVIIKIVFMTMFHKLGCRNGSVLFSAEPSTPVKYIRCKNKPGC